MARGEHSKQATVPIVRWGRENGLKPATASKMASRGQLDPFRPKGADGKVIPKSGISDVAGADRWLRQWQAKQATRDPGLRQGAAAKSRADQERKAGKRAERLKQAAKADIGELDRTHLDPSEDQQAANDRRAQLEADRVELQVAEQRRVLCVRADLLALITDELVRFCRNLETIPRLVCDALITAVQGEEAKVTRAQREAVQQILEAALEERMLFTQSEMEKIYKRSGEPGET